MRSSLRVIVATLAIAASVAAPAAADCKVLLVLRYC